MTIPAPLADCCPRCHPGDHPAVIPFAVTPEGGSLRADYCHQACGTEWPCWWNPDALEYPLAAIGSPL